MNDILIFGLVVLSCIPPTMYLSRRFFKHSFIQTLINSAIGLLACVIMMGYVLGADGFVNLFWTIPTSVALLAGYGYILYKKVAEPMLTLTKELKQIEEGHLELTYITKYTDRVDEVGQMANSLQNSIRRVKDVFQQSGTLAKKVAGACDELSVMTRDITTRIHNQSSAVDAMAEAVELIENEIKTNVRYTVDSSGIAKTTVLQINKSNESALNTLSRIKNIAEKINVINEIAKQTDMLAINTAIEASAAGAQGKGFGVIAKEIRALSEKSREASEEIEELSKKVVESVQQTTDHLLDTSPNVKKSSNLVEKIKDSSFKQREELDRIEDFISRLLTLSKDNASSTDKLGGSVQSLNVNVSGLNDALSYFHKDSV